MDQLHHLVETVVNTLSIVFNGYLLYLISYHSKFGVKLYKYLLIIDASLDLLLGVVTLMAQPVFMTGDGYFVCMLSGFFTGRSPALDSILVSLFGYVLHTNILWIPIQFVYRYRLVCDKAKYRQANVFIIPSIILYLAISLGIVIDYCQVREEFQLHGQYVFDLNGWPKGESGVRKYFIGAYITHWRMISWVSLWTFTCSVSIVIVIWCEMRITKHFNQMGKPTHSNTQRMHKEFHRALLATAICPLITATIPVLYFCFSIAFQLCPGQISAIMAIGTTSITLFNPLTTILCFRCFRQVTARILTCVRHRNEMKHMATTGTQSTPGSALSLAN